MRRAIILLAALGMAGCGGAAGHPSDPEPRLYPFDSAVYLTADEEETARQALRRAEDDCLRERGFLDDRPVKEAGQGREPSNPYGLLDPARAEVDGYGIVPEVLEERQGPPPGEAADSAQFSEALLGTPSGQVTIALPGGEEITIAGDGCVAHARQVFYGAEWDRVYYTFQSLSNQVITATMADHRFATAQRTWSACMAAKGNPAADLQSVRQPLRDQAEQAADADAVRQVARRELAMAKVDAACQREAKLWQVAGQVQGEMERRMLTAELSAGLDTLRRLKADALHQR